MAGKGKRTFWVTTAPTEQHQERCLLLALNGFDVIMLSGIQDVIKSCAEGRPTCVIIDTPIHDSLAGVQSIQTLAVMPELNGVRFILSVTHSAPESLRVAVSENFRDLIPISLLPVQWLQRVQYATAAKPTDFNAPLCEISMNQVAVALAPARVIWISETHIRIECRGNQKPGTSLQISGPMSTAFGVSHVSLTVESVHKDQLMYRFSQALVCKWRISGTAAERASTLIRRLNTEFSDARIRAFIAVTKPETRKIIADCLKLQNFEMKVALQKSTIAQEFSYFSPDIIFMDDRILSSIAEADIQAMFEKLPGDVPVVIYAAPGSHHETFRKLLGSRPIFFESTAHAEHLQTASSRYHITPHAHVDDSHGSKAQIASQHSWSKIELHVPARLRGLNPTVGEIALPFSMGAFTLARLEAPILRKALGRDPYIKITDIVERTSLTQAAQFTHHGHFYLVDVSKDEQTKLGQVLVMMLSDYFQKQFKVTPLSQTTSVAVSNITQIQSFKPIPEQRTAGNLAFKASPPAPAPVPLNPTPTPVAPQPAVAKGNQDQQDPIAQIEAIEDIHPKMKRDFFKSEIELDLSFDWRKKIDPTVVKAVGLFLLAAAFMSAIIWVATGIDESYYKEHGRQYSDFFLRMSDPEFRKNNPVNGPKKSTENP